MMKEFPFRKWKCSTLNDIIKRIDQTERSPTNLLGADWSRRYQLGYRTVSETIVACCCNQCTGVGHIEHRFD